MSETVGLLKLDHHHLAYQQLRAPLGKRFSRTLKSKGKAGVGVVFLGGYASDMNGTKASFLAQCCKKAGCDYLRFDYRGHGLSSGKFEECTIGDWLDDAMTVFDRLTSGPQLLVGSSMGGWMALMLAMKRPERVAGVIGLAAAPDFTKDIVACDMSEEERKVLARDGIVHLFVTPEYPGLPFTQKLIDEANKNHLILETSLPIRVPVHLLQGQQDKEVPWKHALRIVERIEGDNVRVTFIKDGDHRLSRPHDLELMWDIVKKAGGL